ncbi:MAG: ABC transporter permease [Saprospiraceae bacterium]|jgi:lipopolysaccharide transport system permease protein
MNPIKLILDYRLLLRQTTKHEIRKKYTGSYLGMGWMILYPMFFLGAYTTVYLFIFKVSVQSYGALEYILLIFCGLIPFLGFSEALSSGVSAVTANRSLIRNTMFPIELVVVQVLLASQVTSVASTLMLLVSLLFVKGLSVWFLFYPLLWLLQLMFLIGLLWILSSLNVFFRDLQYFINILVLLLMMLSPIAYTIEMIPKGLQFIVYANPISHFIFCSQHLLFLGKMPPTTSLLVVLLLSPALFFVGYVLFYRLKKIMIDYV